MRRISLPIGLRLLLGALFALLAIAVGRWPAPERTASAPGGERVPALSLVVAARDIEYCGPATPCGPGHRTDTIFFVRAVGSEVWALAVPRDTRVALPGYRGKINAVYGFLGPEGLSRAVEQAVGLRVDHHLIFTMDLVAEVVDAVGGIEVYLPAPMDYEDRAANLFIHFPAGRLHLNGEDAVKYMRFRGWVGSDLSRLDRIKEVLLKVAKKAAAPEYWPRLPGLLRTIWDRLETDLPLDQAFVFLPYLKGLKLHAATLPVVEEGPYLVVPPEERARFLKAFFGLGPGRAVPLPEEIRAVIEDGSGAGLGARFAEGFARLGLPRPQLREVGERGVSEVRVDRAVLAGRFYAEAAGLPLVTRFSLFSDADVVIVLGRDLVPDR